MGTFELELQQLLYEVYTSIAFSHVSRYVIKRTMYDYHNLHLNNYLFHFDFQDERSSFYFFGYTDMYILK